MTTKKRKSTITVEPISGVWYDIKTAPKDNTVVDIWRSGVSDKGERCTDMVRQDLGKGNVFYAPLHSGYSCVRDATHWMIVKSPGDVAKEKKGICDSN